MDTQFHYSRLSRAVLLATGLTLIGSHALASGFRIPEVSTVGTATSNALVANTTETGALAYNPAAMSFHDANAINAGLTRITYEPKVDPDNGTATGSTGEDTFLIPNGYFMVDGYDNMSFGLAINAPFGLETEWPSGTFGGFAGQSVLETSLSRIKMFNVNPNIAWQLDDSSSFAFGVNYYDLDELVFNNHGVDLKGSGGDLGWNVAYQKKMNNKLTFGANYRSAVEVDLSGSFHAFDASSPKNTPQAAYSKLEFPDMFQAGFHYQITDKLGVELDAEYTGWSSFDKITVVNGGGTELTSSTNNWDDTWAYRIGAIYQMNPKTKLMFGYSYDESPQPDEHFSARVPDDDRQLFSLGMTRDFGSWDLELAYMLVDVDDRDVNSTDSYDPTADPSMEPNGTDVYNGTYESDSDLISVGMSMEF
ncbi:OmpP1/FadL family transporter [Thiohalophilus thiocyanatoxydans]|uniref:Long-chain fatty acid transport protein n=1 Tax=Thiohalophilus thiocyanatoxydans TaxID=381308 RepID=A0A4R8ILL5_9GAMM|nr:outer membrane protein transport protein [Thiohalophilus thiocyanatoxydans]TDY01686.1 long-chain fatty acid transport protein [Thiohalophilus thiocyanatoxydans]